MKFLRKYTLFLYIVTLLFVTYTVLTELIIEAFLPTVVNTIGNGLIILTILQSFNFRKVSKHHVWWPFMCMFLVILLLGMLFKIQHWPGAIVLLSMWAIGFPVYYLFWKFVHLKQRNWLAILKVVFVFFFCLSKLFILLHWTAGSILQLLALIVWEIYLSAQINVMRNTSTSIS